MNPSFLFLFLFVQTPVTEQSVLGGACLAETKQSLAELQSWQGWVTQYREDMKAGRRPEALELARKLVRSRCSNEHWRFQLVELLTEMKRPEEAIAVIEGFYDRGSNAVESRLVGLKQLTDSQTFKKSKFAAKIEADRQAASKRKSEAQLKMAAMAGHAKQYVAKRACPFECCRYGQWEATEGIVLYDRPGGNAEIVRVAKGEKVVAVTGEVHLEPIPVLVRFTSPYGFSAPVGSIVFLLDRKGEGHGNVWVNGKIVDAEQMWVQNVCRVGGTECWGEFVVPEDEKKMQQESEWWVSIRTRSGKVGWTKEARKFSGIDGCG
ncbi:MAG: hypothetical protein NTW74_23545 [Acidobacteria bacterium]|nr:hypothetical protein [Acidobacteriota bacterium]